MYNEYCILYILYTRVYSVHLYCTMYIVYSVQYTQYNASGDALKVVLNLNSSHCFPLIFLHLLRRIDRVYVVIF